MEDTHPFDDGVGEVHDDVDGAADGDVDGVKPDGIGQWAIVFGESEEMDLVDVHGMEFTGGVDDFPVLIGADFHANHGGNVEREFLLVDVEAVFVFSEGGDEARRGFLFGGEVWRGVGCAGRRSDG